jgi:hypothetical protein
LKVKGLGVGPNVFSHFLYLSAPLKLFQMHETVQAWRRLASIRAILKGIKSHVHLLERLLREKLKLGNLVALHLGRLSLEKRRALHQLLRLRRPMFVRKSEILTIHI